MFRHENSQECTSGLFEIFSTPSTDVSIQSSTFVSYDPIASLSAKSPIIFNIPGNEKYLDLSSSFIKLDVSITKSNDNSLTPIVKDADGDITAGSIVAPINNFLGALISQARVEYNGTTMSDNQNSHAWSSYYQNLFSYGKEARKSWMTLSMFGIDDPGKMSDDNWTKTIRKFCSSMAWETS